MLVGCEGVVVGVESAELLAVLGLVLGDELEGAEGLDAVVEGAGVVPVSGSTYCWSPAEVLVP